MPWKKLINQIKSLLVSVCLGLTLLPQVALADSFAPPSDLPGLPPLKTLKNWFVAHDRTMIVEFPSGVLFKFEILTWGDIQECAVVQTTTTGELKWLAHAGFYSHEYLTPDKPVAYKLPGSGIWRWVSLKTYKDEN